MRSLPIYLPALLFLAAYSGMAQNPIAGKAAPENGPKATVIRPTNLYVSPDTGSTKLAEIVPGREMIVLEHNGPWLQVFANIDEEVSKAQDVPVFGAPAAVPPVSGWIPAAGVVTAQTPNGDAILFGVAATQELDAGQPHPPPNAAQAARLLYRRVADFFPQSPWAPEAAWRSADIGWQLQKEDVFSLPSAREKEAYLREEIDESEMQKLKKEYPHSRWADLADWDMLDNKICGDWQGSTECPKKEAELYLKYAEEHPESPKAAEALYDAVYREGVLNDMYLSNGDNKKAAEAKAKAIAMGGTVEAKYAQSVYAPRAAGLIYKLQQSVPIYGLDRP